MKLEHITRNALPSFSGVNAPHNEKKYKSTITPTAAASKSVATSADDHEQVDRRRHAPSWAQRWYQGRKGRRTGPEHLPLEDYLNEKTGTNLPITETGLTEAQYDNFKRGKAGIGDGDVHFRAVSQKTDPESYREMIGPFGGVRSTDWLPGRQNTLFQLSVVPNDKEHAGQRYVFKYYPTVESGTIVCLREGVRMWNRERQAFEALSADREPKVGEIIYAGVEPDVEYTTAKGKKFAFRDEFDEAKKNGFIDKDDVIVKKELLTEPNGDYKYSRINDGGKYTLQRNSREPRQLMQGDYVRVKRDFSELAVDKKTGLQDIVRAQQLDALMKLEIAISARFRTEEKYRTLDDENNNIENNTQRRDILDMLFFEGNVFEDGKFPYHRASRRFRKDELHILKEEMANLNMQAAGIGFAYRHEWDVGANKYKKVGYFCEVDPVTGNPVMVDPTLSLNKEIIGKNIKVKENQVAKPIDIKSKHFYKEGIWVKPGGMMDPNDLHDVERWDGHFSPNAKYCLHYNQDTNELEWSRPIRGRLYNIYKPLDNQVLMEHNTGLRTWSDVQGTGMSRPAKARWNGTYLVDDVSQKMIMDHTNIVNSWIGGLLMLFWGLNKRVQVPDYNGAVNNNQFGYEMESKANDTNAKILGRNLSKYIETQYRGKVDTDEMGIYKGEYAVGKAGSDAWTGFVRNTYTLGSISAGGAMGAAACAAIALTVAPLSLTTAAAIGATALIGGHLGFTLFERSSYRSKYLISREDHEKQTEANVTSRDGGLLGYQALANDFTYMMDGIYATVFAISNGVEGRDRMWAMAAGGTALSIAAAAAAIATETVTLSAVSAVFIGTVTPLAALAAAATLIPLVIAAASAVVLVANYMGEEQFMHYYDTESVHIKHRNKIMPPMEMLDQIVRVF